jgi:hypothetical protein
MSYGSPTKMLEIARARMTPEQWEKFEADFEHFCAYCGVPAERSSLLGNTAYYWAKWAYLSARPVIARCFFCGEPMDGEHEDDCPQANPHPPIDQRLRDGYFEKIAIASMTDEQAQRSLQRFSMWQRIKGETA